VWPGSWPGFAEFNHMGSLITCLFQYYFSGAIDKPPEEGDFHQAILDSGKNSMGQYG
jgi:hypothetical protein